MPSSTQYPDVLSYKYKPPMNKHELYYEAKIQLRPFSEEVIRFVIDAIDANDQVRISSIEKIKTGVDIYLSSRKFAAIIGKRLKSRFKEGRLLVTKTLFSKDRQTSKDIYRVTVLFRMN